MNDLTPEMLAELERLREENTELKKLFEALTPSGSEFVDSPRNCYLYAKHRIEGAMGVAKERNLYRAALQEIADVSPSDSRWASESVREYARRVLEGGS